VSKILSLLRSALPDVAGDWHALAHRAAPNVFMNPVALLAAKAAGVSRIKVLEAWKGEGDRQTLVGLWALQKKRIWRIGPATLLAPPYDYSFVSNPVVDSDHMEAAVGAFLDSIAGEPSLPKVVRLKYLDADAETYRAIEKVLAARRIPTLQLAEHQRPFATRTAGIKSSGSTRKKLRQDWNRLAALGRVEIVNEREPTAAQEAFEVFLAIEAASWKGSNCTALLSSEIDAAFVRRLFRDLSGIRGASVALLRVDGKPIAAQVLLYSGSMAYTWKTAFDGAFAKYSPGALLIDKVTEQLFVSGSIDAIESCSPEGGFMSQLWAGRRRTVDLLIDVGRRRSMSFLVVMLWEQGYRRLRAIRNDLRSAAWLPDPRRRNAGKLLP
jgi:CelD/BcsL family acetyltransferase involved in cellulose biosynthesis